MRAVMVDIETLGITPDCIILTVGGVKFNPNDEIEPRDRKLWRLDIEEQRNKGRTEDQTAIDFWNKQEPHVREEAFSDKDRISVDSFLNDFNTWIDGATQVWAQGVTFDIVILKDLYDQCGVKPNWSDFRVMDSRTLFKLLKEDPRKQMEFDAHDAAEDSYYQAIGVQRAYKELGIGK